ncbi:4-hydroxythreonine-4-phosphate dehydrogenase PdxA, partial [Flavobacteriaceae bacterium]|nr:4-hydroxythreonine-4-phosphate dehydrogenase PdxA [Flavobacteriaceae bacterium]
MSEISKIRVGISVGDPNGIGFEIILKTFEDKRIFDFFTPIVFAHSKNFIEERKKLG